MCRGLGMIEGGKGIEGGDHAVEGVVDEPFVAQLVGIGMGRPNGFQDANEAFELRVGLLLVGKFDRIGLNESREEEDN